MRNRLPKRLLLSVAPVLAAVVVIGVTPVGPTGASARATAAAADQVEAPIPEIAWEPCDDDLRCASVRVPLDYDEPDGPTIELALAMRPADDRDARVGALFVNPGGPGDSAVDAVPWYAANLPQAAREQFDVIGIDPRGVGGSTPLRCEPAGRAVERPEWAFPLTDGQVRGSLRYDRFVRRSCATGANPIIDHMTTADTARDMDLIRQAVGDEQLTYYGISYGSYLGATYAAMFPDRIRAMVLDGVMDPVGYATGRAHDGPPEPVTSRWGSAEGSWKALTRAFAECDRVGEQRCPLAGESTEKWLEIVDRLRDGPVELGGERLTYQQVVMTAQGALTGVQHYLPLMEFIDARHDAVFGGPHEGDGGDAAAAYRRLREPRAGGNSGEEHLTPVIEGVICADSANPHHPRAWIGAGERNDERAPWFGRMWTWRSSVCANWPGSSQDAYRGPFEAETSAPVLLVAHLHDPSSPIGGARKLNTLLPGSRMLTLDGWGHGALGESACVGSRVQEYLVSVTLPAAGTVCQQDAEPFPAP